MSRSGNLLIFFNQPSREKHSKKSFAQERNNVTKVRVKPETSQARVVVIATLL